jgi:hypothetical protein
VKRLVAALLIGTLTGRLERGFRPFWGQTDFADAEVNLG